MSDSFETWNNDYIDDDAKSIINGYIRNQTKSLNVIQSIPKDIINLVSYYIDDHFMMYRGSYQWKINSPAKLKCISSSQPDQVFNSDIFSISKLKWIITLHPNGTLHQNGFLVSVKLITMPSAWEYILIQQSIICHETNTKYHAIKSYEPEQS